MNRASSYFPLIVVAILAAATFWLQEVVRNESHSGLGNSRHDPDLVASTILIDRFDATGKHITRITAHELRHYPDNDTADLDKPVITLMRDNKPTVFSSDTARAFNETKLVTLFGKVRGLRAPSADAPGLTLSTEQLSVLTDDEIAQNEQPIVLTHGLAIIEGVGMEWNNVTGQFLIKDQARSTFPPRKAH